MRYRRQTADGDYTFGRGRADYLVNTPETVAASIRSRLKLHTGEWFLDITDGTPYDEEVLGYGTAATRDLAIKDRIAGTQGVKSIDDFFSTFDPITRHYSFTATVMTIYGPTTITESI